MEKLEANSDQTPIEEDPDFKFWPCEDTNFKCETAKAEKIIRDMDRKQAELHKETQKIKIEDLGSVYTRLYSAMCKDWYTKQAMDRALKCEVEPLKQALDKICFRNKSHLFEKEGAEVNYRNIDFKIRHGNKSMAAENRLLKEINKIGSQEREVTNSNKQIFSLGSKQEIQEKINHYELKIEQSRNERLKNSYCIKNLKKKLKAIEIQILALESHMEQEKRRREQVRNLQRLLIHQHEEKDRCCFRHFAALNNAIEIVQKKDVTGSPI
ncbi:uncharacterized protein LOC126657805 isoform X1 [Mercurialis annua]|uniref:uncharacterized protein LOC126657805 isoform X1 n=1 Tax=Mercurialis annua TaxID=3986 RepID=UPI00215F1DDA|nr:uncharacterized protein LOC126657805 isoform X1 [Mercurialis annua]